MAFRLSLIQFQNTVDNQALWPIEPHADQVSCIGTITTFQKTCKCQKAEIRAENDVYVQQARRDRGRRIRLKALPSLEH